MKYNKILGLSALSLMMVGFVGCTDEVDYTPAESMTNAQVFFATDAVSSVDLMDGQNSAVVNVSRLNTSGSVTVDVTSSAVVATADGAVPTDLFSIPSSVTFADGQDSAPITISFDFSKIEAETDYTVTLNISGEGVTPYGKNQQTVSILYAPWSEWAAPDGGEEAFYTNGSPFDVAYYNPIEERRSLLSPNLVQYRLLNLLTEGYDIEFSIDESTGIVTAPNQETGYKNGGNMIYFCDTYSFYTDVLGRTPEQAADYLGASFFDPETGLVTINTAFYYIDGTSIRWWGENFDTVQLPGYPDYNITMLNNGTYINEAGQEFTIIDVEKGADVASYAINLFTGQLSSEEIAAEADKMIANTETTLYNDNREFQFPVSVEDYYTCVAVAYGSDGIAKGHSSYVFYNEINQKDWNEGWTTVTKNAIFQDVFFANVLVGVSKLPSWEVEVQQLDEVPGVYRIVKPYASNPYDLEVDRGHYYVVIDASDPDNVTVMPSVTCTGYAVLSCEAGKFDGKKFIFPPMSLGVFNGYNPDGSMITAAGWQQEAVLLDLDPQPAAAKVPKAGKYSFKSNVSLPQNPLMFYTGKALGKQAPAKKITKSSRLVK